MNQFDLGWLCGLLEGDGTFTFDGKHPRISVKMTDLDTVQRAALYLGSNVLGPYAPEGSLGDKEVYVAYISGAKARTMMQTIRKHMSHRRKNQIDVLLGGQHEMFSFPRSL